MRYGFLADRDSFISVMEVIPKSYANEILVTSTLIIIGKFGNTLSFLVVGL